MFNPERYTVLSCGQCCANAVTPVSVMFIKKVKPGFLSLIKSELRHRCATYCKFSSVIGDDPASMCVTVLNVYWSKKLFGTVL